MKHDTVESVALACEGMRIGETRIFALSGELLTSSWTQLLVVEYHKRWGKSSRTMIMTHRNGENIKVTCKGTETTPSSA